MLPAADEEATAAQPVRQKIVFNVESRQFYPAAMWELVSQRVTNLFAHQEGVTIPDGAVARVEVKKVGLLRWALRLEFEIFNGSSMFMIEDATKEAYRLFIKIGSRKFDCEITRLDE